MRRRVESVVGSMEVLGSCSGLEHGRQSLVYMYPTSWPTRQMATPYTTGIYTDIDYKETTRSP